MILLLYSAIWIAAAILIAVVGRGAASTRSRYTTLLLGCAALVYSTYRVGEFDGRGRYYASLRAELSPFLRLLSDAPEEKKREAVRDFFFVADESKTTPDEYLASLKHAHGILKKEPNKSPEPTPTSVMPAAEQPSRRP